MIRALAVTLGVMAVVGSAVAALGGLLGWAHGWLDGFNHFGLMWASAALVGACLCLAAPAPHRRLLVGAALASAGVALAPIVWEPLRPGDKPFQAPPGAATLKVLSFNLYWRLASIPAAAAIRASGADVVALQQVYPHAATMAGLLDVYPYQFVCGPGCSTAILSKQPILATGKAPPPPRGRHDLIWASTQAPDGRPFIFAASHLNWPVPGLQDPADAELGSIASRLGVDSVLAGDFNITPWSYRLRRLDRRLTPMIRRTRGLLSWPAAPTPLPPVVPPFVALDQIYAGPAWRTVSVQRLPRGGSDHYPILVELVRD